MAKRVFISFAVEDSYYRDLLKGQARNKNSPFEFVDMSVKEPWKDSWKTQCRTRIKGCAGIIAIVTKNSKTASGQLWEVKCAKEEGKRVRGIYATTDNRPASLPSEFDGVRKVSWSWDNIKSFIDSL